ncbi:MAG TPA: endonuclease VII domain-containing protein [Streptosporangiaceae bacterium]
MAENKTKNHGSTRSYHLKRRYGLTAEEVAKLQWHQLDRCLICFKLAMLHVDHDHATGDFRGLLCFNCNNGLGRFPDNSSLLRRAADYLDGAALSATSIAGRPSGTPTQAAPASRSWSMGAVLRRHYRLTSRYGIGLGELYRMLEEQGGVCPICREDAPTDVDHDHETGAVRGILCSSCNTGMGQFKDDPVALRRAAEYLDGNLVRMFQQASGAIRLTVGDQIPAPETSPFEALVAQTIRELGAN